MRHTEEVTNKDFVVRWAIAFTASHAEQRVKRELESRGIECIVPLYTRTYSWRGRVVHVDVPQLPRCVLIRISPSDIALLSDIPELIVPRDILEYPYPECLSIFFPK